MDKVYLVFIDEGSYDSHWIRVDKVFSNKEKADEYAKSINDKWKELKALLPKDKSEEDDFDMSQYDEYYKNYIKECEDFKNIHNINVWDVKEFNKAIVEEFEIN